MPVRATIHDLESIISFQHLVYAENRLIIGTEPVPLMVDYHGIFGQMEFWIEGSTQAPDGVVILDFDQDETGADLYLWSIATHPQRRSSGLGNRLLAFAEERAKSHGKQSISLSTNSLLTDRISWYRRHGFDIARHEPLPDRVIVHMRKDLIV